MIINDPNPKGLVRGSDAWKLFRSPRWYPTIAAAEDPASSTRSSCHHIQLLVFDVHFHLSFTMAKYSRWTKRSILDQHGLQKISAWLCSAHQAERSLLDDLDQWYRRNGKWRYETVTVHSLSTCSCKENALRSSLEACPCRLPMVILLWYIITCEHSATLLPSKHWKPCNNKSYRIGKCKVTDLEECLMSSNEQRLLRRCVLVTPATRQPNARHWPADKGLRLDRLAYQFGFSVFHIVSITPQSLK